MRNIPTQRLYLAAFLGLFPLVSCLLLTAMNQGGNPPEALFIHIAKASELPELTATVDNSVEGSPVLLIQAENFKLLNSCVKSDWDANKLSGHIHIVKDNEKIASAYSRVFPLDLLEAGEHTLTLSLHGPDHRAFVTDDGMITATVTVMVN